MQTFFGFPDLPIKRPVFLTIGNFDGVHRGHQNLIHDMVKSARHGAGLAGLITFEPHPLTVLRPDQKIVALTSPAERGQILAALGLDLLLILPFSQEMAAQSAADFVDELVSHLNLRELWIGPDFALGRGREGNSDHLRVLGETLGFRVQTIAPYTWRGEAVRSSRIRTLLSLDGDVAGAADLLGRPYEIWGEVRRGAQRGRTLGFPTANMFVPKSRLAPAYGVYACWAWCGDRGFPAVVNMGVRPSFDNGAPTIEAHLIDFEGDLYGEQLGLSFVQRLRGEQRFTDIQALIAQVGQDAAAAKQILAHPLHSAGDPKLNFWQELSHTADWSIQVTAESQEALFACAAGGMFSLQGADPGLPITLARTITVAAGDVSELLVGWLNELLVCQELDAEMYTRFAITEISATGIRAIAYGYPGTPSQASIKATTFYELDIQTAPSGWKATVTFDV